MCKAMKYIPESPTEKLANKTSIIAGITDTAYRTAIHDAMKAVLEACDRGGMTIEQMRVWAGNMLESYEQ